MRLPSHLSKLHNMSHISLLKKYILDSIDVLERDNVQIKKDLLYGVKLTRV